MLSLRKLFAVMKATRRPKNSFKKLGVLGTGTYYRYFNWIYMICTCMLCINFPIDLYRYRVTASIGQGHQVLGEVMRSSTLNGTELAKLEVLLESMDARKCIVYGRVLISGTMYSSAMYNRSDITNDSIISLSSNGSTLVGTVQKYVSYCQ